MRRVTFWLAVPMLAGGTIIAMRSQVVPGVAFALLGVLVVVLGYFVED